MWTKFAVWALLFSSAATAQEPQWLDLGGNYLGEVDPQEGFLAGMLYRVAARAALGQKRDLSGPSMAAELGAQALQGKNTNVASRLFARATAGAQGRPIGEPFELAYSLQFHVEARIVTAGAPVRARVEPLLMPAEPGLKQQYTVEVKLKDAKGAVVRTAKGWKVDRFEAQDFTLATSGLADGEYLVAYELRDGQAKVLAAVERPVLLSAGLRDRIRALDRRLPPLAGKAAPQLALQTAQGLVETYRSALTGYPAAGKAKLSPLSALLAGPDVPLYPRDGFDPAADLALAEDLIAGLEAGQDRLTGRKGRIRLGNVWTYVPAREKPAGLVVAISGEWGDGSALLESLAPAAERAGLVIAGVEAGANVEAILAQVRVLYPAGKVFLLGHGGGTGVALQAAPRGFAAVALVGGIVASWAQFEKKMPLPAKVIGSTADGWLETDEFRRFAYQAAQHFPQFEYSERGGAGRLEVLTRSADEICEFFTQTGEGKWKPNGLPIPLPASIRNRD